MKTPEYMTTGEIVRECGINKQNVSPMITRLRQRGFVVSERVEPGSILLRHRKLTVPLAVPQGNFRKLAYKKRRNKGKRNGSSQLSTKDALMKEYQTIQKAFARINEIVTSHEQKIRQEIIDNLANTLANKEI
jgi:hypothetical protein